MTMMLLEWVITSVFLILTVLALRAAFGRRVSARLRYALWAVVLVRLLVPVQLFTSPLAGTRFFSESRAEQNVTEWPVTSDTNFKARPDDWPHLDLPDGLPVTYFPAASQAPEPPTAPIAPEAPDLTKIPAYFGWVWLGGSVALALVLAASNLRFALRLRRSRIPMKWLDCPLPVYAAAGLPSPCLFGLIRPAVYVTPEAAADPVRLRHVIAHEYTHFRQGDHLWSFLRCAALAAHWWNPLVWVSVKLSRRDGELACDEGALKRLGDGERLAYGNTLLALVTAKPGPGDLLCFATTMAGEKKSLKERISRIANAPKRWLWAAVAVVLVTVLACACAFGQAADPDPADTADPDSADTSDLTADLTFSLDEENSCVRIEGSIDGMELEHTLWFTPSWIGLYDDLWPKLGLLEFEMPLCGGEVVCGLDARWTDESRTVVRVTATPRAVLSSYAPSGNLIFTVDLSDGTLLELEGYIPKLSAGQPERVPTEAEAVRTARIAAKLLTKAESYYRNYSTLSNYIPAVGLMWNGCLLRDTEALDSMTDLNRDGVPETVIVGDLYDREVDGTLLGRGAAVMQGDLLLWINLVSSVHAEQTSYLLYSVDGEDYLMALEIHGKMGKGCGFYQVFTLENGTETTVWENSIDFDYCNYGNTASVKDNFDPVAVAAFMDEADGLLEHCTLLVDTGRNCLDEPSGQLRVNLRGTLESYAPGFIWDDGQTTLENLRSYKKVMEAEQYVMGSPLLTVMNGTQENARIRLSYGDKSTQFIADYWCFNFQSADQVPFQVLDLNGDGKDEIVFPLVWAHGTGVYIEKLYVFDAGTLEQYDTSGLNEAILSSVVSTGDEDNFYLSAGGERITIPRSEAQPKEDPDAFAVADKLSLDNIICYTVRDGQVSCWLGCDPSGMSLSYIGFLNIPVDLTPSGGFSCGSARYTTERPFE